jgi:hypothetical protein|tara:strand:+ start:1488 stop:1751 length:264 start_codon:yes stop_codon:yes gene_type:complete
MIDTQEKQMHIEMEIAITKQKLIDEVEFLVRADDLTYVEALMQVSEEYEIEPEDIGKMIDGPLKIKMEAESVQLNRIKGKKPLNTLY